MTDNPFAQGDYQHSVSVQGTEADNGWVLTKAQWDHVMAALHQHGIMDANTTLDSPHPDLRTKTVGFGGGFGLLDQDGIRLSSPSRIYWGTLPVPTFPYAEIVSDRAFYTGPVSVTLEDGSYFDANNEASISRLSGGAGISNITLSLETDGTSASTTFSLDSSDSNGFLSFTNAVLALFAGATDPSSLVDGSTWYRSDLDAFRVYANGIARNLSDDGDWSEKTIAAGVITATTSRHTVDTQSDAASDDLDTINGLNDGQLLILVAASSARTVVVKNATGNLRLEGDCTLDNAYDTLVLVKKGSDFLELKRSNNGA